MFIAGVIFRNKTNEKGKIRVFRISSFFYKFYEFKLVLAFAALKEIL